MKCLTKKQFEKAREFMYGYAQDIDLAMFQYYFENKPQEQVIEVLEKYQNEDGGFGTLDYDFCFSKSCLKQTESACRYIFALNAPETHSMIPKLMKYIVENYNMETGEWDNLIVPEVNDFPHAWWWEYEDKEKTLPKNYDELIANYNPNTNSALAGMVMKYSRYVPEELAEYIKKVVTDKIMRSDSYFQYGMMSDLYFVNALSDENLKSELLKRLMGDGKLFGLLDEGWGTERAHKACIWINSPNHPYYAMYKNEVDDNHTKLIEAQNEDGSWSPNWQWGTDEIWKDVERRHKGLMTCNFLWSLFKFGRIESDK